MGLAKAFYDDAIRQTGIDQLGFAELGGTCHHWSGHDISIVDCDSPGSPELGRILTSIATGGQAEYSEEPAELFGVATRAVRVRFRTNVGFATLGAQFAGEQFKFKPNPETKKFWMVSGPCRTAAAREDIFRDFGIAPEDCPILAVLEGDDVLDLDAAIALAKRLGLSHLGGRFFRCRTNGESGKRNVLSRSVECLAHVAHDLGLDTREFSSGEGLVPLSPFPVADKHAMGVTNDLIRCAGEVSLTWEGDPSQLGILVGAIESAQQEDRMISFDETMTNAGWDMTKVPPATFAPAVTRITVSRNGGEVIHIGKKNLSLLRSVLQHH